MSVSDYYSKSRAVFDRYLKRIEEMKESDSKKASAESKLQEAIDQLKKLNEIVVYNEEEIMQITRVLIREDDDAGPWGGKLIIVRKRSDRTDTLKDKADALGFNLVQVIDE